MTEDIKSLCKFVHSIVMKDFSEIKWQWKGEAPLIDKDWSEKARTDLAPLHEVASAAVNACKDDGVQWQSIIEDIESLQRSL